jgi:hypothetical protein
MSQLNDTNYPNATPVAADYFPFVKDSDSTLKTVTMQGAADLFASLASQNVSVDVENANVTLTTEQMVVANSGGAFNITLPASSLNTGRTFYIANKGAGAVTILPNGADTIEGAASLVLAQYDTATLRSDGLGMWMRF